MTRTPNYQILGFTYEHGLASERLSTRGGGGWGHLIPPDVSARLRRAASLATRLEALAAVPHREKVADDARTRAVGLGSRYGCEAVVAEYLGGLDTPTAEPRDGWHRIALATRIGHDLDLEPRHAAAVARALEAAQQTFWDLRTAREWSAPVADHAALLEARAEIAACLSLPLESIAAEHAGYRADRR